MKKPIINYDDFAKLDIIVGQIVDAQDIEASQKLLKLNVDLGSEYSTVEILAGIKGYYKPKSLIGKKYLFLANLEPRKMMGLMSNGMLLAINQSERPILIKISGKIPPGTIIS
jgi:methionyl-tRNA synthetase